MMANTNGNDKNQDNCKQWHARLMTWFKTWFRTRRHWARLLIYPLVLVIFYAVWYLANKLPIGGNSTDHNDNVRNGPCIHFCLSVCGNKQSFNISSDPYQTGCGWKAKAVMQPTTDVEVIDILEEPNTEYTIEPVKMVKKLFKSCINQVNKKRRMQPYRTYIFNELQKMPKYTDHIAMLRSYLRITGHLPWFKYSIKSEYYGKTIVLELTTTYNTHIMHSILEDLITLEKTYPTFANYENISRIFCQIWSLKSKHSRKLGHAHFIINSFTLKKVLPDLSLVEIFDDILKKSKISMENITFTIMNRESLTEINNLIKGTSIKDFMVIVLLDVFQEFYAKFPILRKEFNIEETYATSTSGYISQRRKDCLATVNLLREILNWMYIEKSFDHQVKEKVISIKDHLISATKDLVSEITWLDERSKKKAFYKLEQLKGNFSIGFEHSELRKQKLIKDYANLNITDDFVLNVFNLNKFLSDMENMRMLDDEKNIVSQTDDLPVYNERTNSINIPLASLQPPLFTKDGDMVRNFAGLGILIGREIFRDFEITDKTYSEHMWISRNSYIGYRKLQNNIINKFTKREVESENTSFNEVQKANDILADIFGLKVASQAFLEWKSDNFLGKIISWTRDDQQKFFFELAHIFCTNGETNPDNYSDDRRTFKPNTARLHKLLQNYEMFSKAFQCPEDASMNPQPKLEL